MHYDSMNVITIMLTSVEQMTLGGPSAAPCRSAPFAGF